MKKILSIFAISALLLTSVGTHEAKAQTLVKLNQGGTNDTLIASQTVYSPVVNLNYSVTQAVTVTTAVDSISGAPAGSFIVQHSTDGIHWNQLAGDTITYTSTGWNHNGIGSGESRTYICQFKTFYPFYGAYARVKITTTSAARRSRYWITLKSSNYNQ